MRAYPGTSALCHQRKSSKLFDHFVSAADQHAGNIEAERFGRFEIDYELIFVRRLNGQVSRFLAPEDTVNVFSRTSILVDNIGAVGDQAAVGDKETLPIDCRKFVLGCQRDG
jgi:hypothetical protein